MSTALNTSDVSWIIARLPKAVKDAMKFHHAILAGGFIRSVIAKEEVNDIDLFAPTKEKAGVIAEFINSQLPVSMPLIKTDNAFTVRNPYGYTIQVIHRWTFDDLVTCVHSFDFTIAKAGIKHQGTNNDGKDQWRSYCDGTFYEDLAARRLVYTSPEREEEAGGSMLRVLKFTKKGYHIPLASLAAVIARLSNAVKYSELPRVDNEGKPLEREAAITHVLTGLLYEVDPSIEQFDNGDHQ